MKAIDIVNIKLVKKEEMTIKAKSIDDAADILTELIGNADVENFAVLLLDTRKNVNAAHIMAVGSIDDIYIDIAGVFKAAILAGSRHIIVGHNHPSGEPNPSQYDIETTEKIKKAGELLGIKLVDHIIVTQNEHYSFFAAGLL